MKHVPPGYPLPAGELGSDEIVCQLVYLPDRPEYWQALYMAISYFATWRAWERDDDKRGKDAASDWRTALELTTECWRMACLDEVTDRMDDIIAMLAMKKDCCDDNITYGPGTEVTTEIEPDVGDPPDYYGETAVTDWDDWREHVCHNAHVWVDSLVWQANEMDVLTQLGGVTIGAVGAGLLLLGAAGLLIAVPYAAVALTAAGILAAGSFVIFLTTADDIEDAREDIVCALIQGGSVHDVIEDALGDTSLDWLLFFSQVDYDSVTAIIYEGGYESQYLPADLRDDCDTCEYQQEDNTSVHVEKVWGESVDYNSETKEWTIPSWGVGGCEQSSFTLWETPSKVVKKPCKVVVTSCTGSTQCSTLESDRGILDSVEVYDYTHPPLAHLGLSLVDNYRHLHVATVEYDLTFKLYTIP